MSKPLDLELDEISRVAVIVAHPDDETLWAGGLLLSHPEWSPFIVSLCRGKDLDRAPRFMEALDSLGAKGAMGDLDDGPDQIPLPAAMVQDAILSLLPVWDYDLLLTHSPQGEYTRHRRHEEISQAVQVLCRRGDLSARRILEFAYEDGGGAYFPRPRKEVNLRLSLPEELWTRKYNIITEIYGFDATGWEAQTTPRVEAFDCFTLTVDDPGPGSSTVTSFNPSSEPHP